MNKIYGLFLIILDQVSHTTGCLDFDNTEEQHSRSRDQMYIYYLYTCTQSNKSRNFCNGCVSNNPGTEV